MHGGKVLLSVDVRSMEQAQEKERKNLTGMLHCDKVRMRYLHTIVLRTNKSTMLFSEWNVVMVQMGKPERDKGLCVMKKEYGLSRVILVVLALVAALILCQNEDYTMKQVVGFFFCSAALLASFLGTPVSRKMIQTGDEIPNILLRILYYLGLLVGSLAIAALVGVGCVTFFGNVLPLSDGMEGIGQALLIVLFGSALFVFLIVPYLQTIIVLLLRKIFPQKGGL